MTNLQGDAFGHDDHRASSDKTTLQPDHKLVLVDVGGQGGLEKEWEPFYDRITPIVFEPNPASAADLREVIEGRLGGKVLEVALAAEKGHRILNITAAAGCVSLLEPDVEVLSQFSVAAAFEVRDRIVVECVRYDSLHREGRVPAPEAIKIDVQGFEYEVLQGFGDTLESCLGVEMEVHLYPIYKGERLLADYVSLLERFGLYLRKLDPINHFDGFGVEYDAWFTCGPDRIGSLSEGQLKKLLFLEEVWRLPERRRKFTPHMFAAP